MKRFRIILCCLAIICTIWIVASCGSSLRYTANIIPKTQNLDSAMVSMVNFEVPFPAKWDTLWVGTSHMTKTWFIEEKGKVKHQFTLNELDSVYIIMYRRVR